MSPKHLARTLTVKYALTLIALAGLALANYLILAAQIYAQRFMADVVNASGRQRDLLQRVAMAGQELLEADSDEDRARVRDELSQSIDTMEATHHALISERGLAGTAPPPAVGEIYFDSPWLLDSKIRNVIAQARSLSDVSATDLDHENPHWQFVHDAALSGSVSSALDAVVHAYQEEAKAKNDRLQRLSLWSLGSTVGVLAVTGLFVFRPMVHRVRDDVVQLEDLNATLAQRVQERTAQVEQHSRELALSGALYRSLVDHLPMSVLRKDLDGRFTFANDRFSHLLGRPPDDIMGKTDFDVFAPKRAEKYVRDDRRVVQGNMVLQEVEEFPGPHGRDRFVEVIKAPLRSPEGEVIGTQTVFCDVTARKLAERRALQAERLAAIGQTVTGVAHESRNALQQIQACAHLLEWELDGNGRPSELLADLQEAQERLRRLFDDLRGYASARKLEVRLSHVGDVLRQAWSSLAHQRKNRNVTLDEDRGAVDLQCPVDPYQFEQVFANILENTLKVCRDPVKLRVRYSETSINDKPALRISIRDNGPGFPPDLHQRVFEPFFTTSTRGTGLGLAIAKRVVEEHGGCIGVGDATDRGAEIMITIPGGRG